MDKVQAKEKRETRAYRRWDLELCRQEALKYKSKRDFHRGSDSAYRAACANKWISEFKWLKDGRSIAAEERTMWTFEACKEKALEFKYKRDFKRSYNGAYQAAVANKWISEFTWLLDGRSDESTHRLKWTYEKCFEEAKKYETVTDFENGSNGAYHRAFNKGWMKDYTWFIDGNKRNGLRHTKWTYDVCFELAKQCKNRTEFLSKHNKACKVAERKGWIVDYTWFEVEYEAKDGEEESKSRPYKWDYDACLEIAKQCSRPSEMEKKNSSAYKNARKYGWINDYTWFTRRNGGMTFEECYARAKKFTSKREFEARDPYAYHVARYRKWFPQFYWFIDGRALGQRKNIPTHRTPWNKKYTEEGAEEVARKCKTKAEFRKMDEGYYFYALRSHIMSRFTWLQSEQHLYDAINYVYRYHFPEYNAVYVGRTINPDKRDFEHRRERGKESSAVLKFAKEKGIEVPMMEILEKGLTGEESQIKENEYVCKYRDEGYLVLNKGATGKATGSMGMKRKHTLNKFLEVAKRYTRLSDFKRENIALYDAANKYGWIKECDWLERGTRLSSTFTKEFCMSVARQCSSRKELGRRDPTVYLKMLKLGWLDECDWLESAHKGRKDMPHDYCIDIAKQYTTANQLNKKYQTVAKKLYKTGWIKECSWLLEVRRPVNQYTLEGVFVGSHSSAYEAEKAFHEKVKYFHQSIALACEGKKPSAYGFLWRYADAEPGVPDGQASQS